MLGPPAKGWVGQEFVPSAGGLSGPNPALNPALNPAMGTPWGAYAQWEARRRAKV